MSVAVSKLPLDELLTQQSAVTRGRKNPLWYGVPDRLRRIREQAGMSGAQLAQVASCGKNVALQLEAGAVTGRIDIIERLAFGLGISPAWLAFGSEAWIQFRQKQRRVIRAAIDEDDPVSSPGQTEFRERYRSCSLRLHAARERSGLSLRELAGAASVSYQAVQNTESGKTIPKVDTIEAIAVALDVAPGWLAFGDEDEAADAPGRLGVRAASGVAVEALGAAVSARLNHAHHQRQGKRSA